MYLDKYLFTESPDESYISHKLVSRKYCVLVLCRKSNAITKYMISEFQMNSDLFDFLNYFK